MVGGFTLLFCHTTEGYSGAVLIFFLLIWCCEEERKLGTHRCDLFGGQSSDDLRTLIRFIPTEHQEKKAIYEVCCPVIHHKYVCGIFFCLSWKTWKHLKIWKSGNVYSSRVCTLDVACLRAQHIRSGHGCAFILGYGV